MTRLSLVGPYRSRRPRSPEDWILIAVFVLLLAAATSPWWVTP
jgi:hypothetical protein